MKSLKITLIAILALAGTLASCDRVMDTSPKETYSEEAVWNSASSAYSYVYNVYRWVIQDRWVMWNVSDWEIRSGNMAASGEDWYNNNYFFGQEDFDENKDFGFFGEYGTARAINMIEQMSNKYRGKTLTENEADELVSQARFLRGMFYFRQARALGRVVWIDEVLTPADTMGNALTNYVLTESTEVTYEKVINELEEAIKNLPKSKAQGVINRYAGIALLNEVCLQAAAYQPDLTKRADLLKKVITYADLLESEGGYSLTTDYEGMFNERKNANLNEIIFAIYRNRVNTDFTGTDMIRTMANIKNDNFTKPWIKRFVNDNKFEGWGRIYPTQNLVDNYLVKDEATGQAVKWYETSQFTNAVNIDAIPRADHNWIPEMWKGESVPLRSGSMKTNTVNPKPNVSELMYKNRDKRFYGSIIYDSCEVYGETITTRTWGNWNPASSDRSTTIYGHHMSLTDYYSRKQLYNDVDNGVLLGGNKSDYHWVVFRLGRVVLNKAEAQLWLAGMGDTYSASDAVATFNRTRTTHGELPASTAATLQDAWKDYLIERRVELYYENDLYWSAMRWGKHGGFANGGQPAGGVVQVLMEKPSSIQFSPDCSEFTINSVFRGNVGNTKFSPEKRYLLPIPKKELLKNPKLGKQNPGWPE